MNFNGLQLTKSEEKGVPAKVEVVSLSTDDLPAGNVTIKVSYSTLNYKDALAITSHVPIARISPLVLGIDGVGTVTESQDNRYKVGQKVVLNGWGVGEKHWGCLAQYARLDADWLIPLPKEISEWDAMAIGTAGYTAALCVERILHLGVKPEHGPVLVTGSTGGVGSVAVALLTKLGYQVAASTGKPNEADYLRKLGATQIVDRNEFSQAGKPLQKEIWAAAVDTVGSHTLANVCAQMKYDGVVAACGLAQGMDFPATVAPFILRGVTLAGIDSVMVPYARRIKAWKFLAKHLDMSILRDIATTITLKECVAAGEAIIAGKVKGRYIVDVNA
ncbi:acrylyl-CoA reductase (NADPH) [Zophobihabitans entericus]|uniref:Oxidoreductase n=1 Tax=Zophobihabitans entericus TaxID=1635327 RepID=A0A6G9ICN3_9GAMM|nr:MDR family oxidoreductase [Zophobihabitans entericus]QIQ21991.1 oxidoreductase [Zophobihabitans entericus]